MRFEGKTVLISGATGGFGTRAAERFSEEGASVVLADLSEDGIEAVAATLKGPVVGLAGDVREAAYHDELVDLALSEFGALDVAVNNAGIGHALARLPDISERDVRAVLDVDLLGVIFAMQAQLPVMAGRFEEDGLRGAIVNIASAAGLMGSPFMSVYAAAKHGVVGLTKSAAAEYGRKGVRVNAICPSFADTAIITPFLDANPKGREAAVDALTRAIPMGRLASVDEVVEAILFAAASENSFMTGETLSVDGGLAAI